MSQIVDIKDTIPERLIAEGPGWAEYSESLSVFTERLAADAIGLRRLLTPEETPDPDVLAGSMGAYSSIFDDADETRRKAGSAVRFAKKRRVFTESWKPILDRIMSTDTRIWRGKWTQGGFTVGVSYVGLHPVGGAGGLTVGSGTVGIDPVGGPRPPYQDWKPGDVLIDLVNAPTSDQTRRIRAQFAQICPTYFRVWTGNVQTLFGDYYAPDFDSDDYSTSEEVFVVADFLNRYQYVNWKP